MASIGKLHRESLHGIDFIALPDKRLKSCSLRLTFHLPVQAKHAPANTMLAPMLVRGSERYPDMRAISQRCEELYGLSLRGRLARAGRRQFLSLTLRFVAPKYLPRGMHEFREIVEFARTLVMEPLTVRGAFSPEIFEAEQRQALQNIDALIDNKQRYALRQAWQRSFPDSPYGTPEYGSRHGIAELSAKTAYQRWQKVVNHAPLTVHLYGPVQAKKHLGVVQEAFKQLHRDKLMRVGRNQVLKHVGKAGRVRETTELEQAYVVLTYVTGWNAKHKDFAAMAYADAIFGRLSTSRLFSVVREELGLAYMISSSIDASTGCAFALAATDPKESAQAAKVMKEQLRRLVREGIGEADFAAARATLLDEEASSQDSPGSIVSNMLLAESCGTVYDPKQAMEDLQRVTSADVNSALQRYSPVLDYRLLQR